MNLRRPLDTKILAETFAESIFDETPTEDLNIIASKIFKAELSLAKLESHPTSTNYDFRSKEYRQTRERKKLRRVILSELINMLRLQHDDDIKFGSGGAKPKTPIAEQQAYLVSGAPASGKSGIATRLADETGAYILDSDYAKRKFPEYSETDDGASLVHEEADDIIFASEECLFEFCVYSQFNMVIPLVGRTYKSMDSIISRLQKCGYSVHLINVALDRKECVRRAYKRFCKTSRYVPLSYIFDEVGNEPERIYFLLKRAHGNMLASYAQLSTEGLSPSVLECSDGSPIASWEV